MKQHKYQNFSKLNLLILLLILISGAVIAANLYFYATGSKTLLREITTLTEIQDDLISAREAEIENLKLVNKKPVDQDFLRKDVYLENSYTFNKSKFQNSSTRMIEILNDGTVDFSSSSNEVNIPIVFIKDYESFKLTKNDAGKIAKSLRDALIGKRFEGIELEYSLAIDLEFYYELIAKLSEELKGSEINIQLGLLPMWGNTVDYSYHKNYKAVYGTKIDFNKINQYVETFKIYSLDYTTPNSIHAGPLTPLDWFEQIIQYHISNGVPREKMLMAINTLGYKWVNREYYISDLDNFVNEELQSEVLTVGEIENLPDYKKSESSTGDVMLKFREGENDIIIVYPPENYIKKLEELVSEYGLGGVFYRI
jgi:hypothetical protein